MREAFESESRSTGKDRLLITMAVPASLEYAGKVRVVICANIRLALLLQPGCSIYYNVLHFLTKHVTQQFITSNACNIYIFQNMLILINI